MIHFKDLWFLAHNAEHHTGKLVSIIKSFTWPRAEPATTSPIPISYSHKWDILWWAVL